MTTKLLLLCGCVLLVAGCTSYQTPFANMSDFSFTYDLAPPPVDLTPAELTRIEQVQTTATISTNGIVRQDLDY
jgi:hypothetical protein